MSGRQPQARTQQLSTLPRRHPRKLRPDRQVARSMVAELAETAPVPTEIHGALSRYISAMACHISSMGRTSLRSISPILRALLPVDVPEAALVRAASPAAAERPALPLTAAPGELLLWRRLFARGFSTLCLLAWLGSHPSERYDRQEGRPPCQPLSGPQGFWRRSRLVLQVGGRCNPGRGAPFGGTRLDGTSPFAPRSRPCCWKMSPWRSLRRRTWRR